MMSGDMDSGFFFNIFKKVDIFVLWFEIGVWEDRERILFVEEIIMLNFV